MTEAALQQKLEQLELLNRIGKALSAEKNKDRLFEMILVEAKNLCSADGGTLYLRTDADQLKFVIMRTDSLDIALGGTTGKEISLPPIHLFDPETKKPNQGNVATQAALSKTSIHIPDAYDADGFDFSGTKKFDELNNYRSTSLLAIPMVNTEGRVIGVLQLLNAQDPETGNAVPFEPRHQEVVESLASQAAIALDNQLLLDDQKQLLQSFIEMIASAIDHKSPYTGGHCERVPILTELLARKACDAAEGPFADFSLTDEGWYELRIAAWMHDCGKVITPVHVMDKATKLETIADRIQFVRARADALRLNLENRYLKAQLESSETFSQEDYEREIKAINDDISFLETANIGSEFITDDAKERIQNIGERTYTAGGEVRRLLTDDEIYNLSISRGTLTNEERIEINKHMVHTINMLHELPFPRNLQDVPEIAGGHHEKMDGTGYPKGLFAGDMSIPARMIAIADVFEALTAQDRPYKKGKTLSESMRIMGFMKKDNHLDPDLFDLFVTSKAYLEYGKRFLPDSLLDDVDEAGLLAIQPKEYDLPEAEERKKRWLQFLPEYGSGADSA
jgi:HD-GYP domain-containing protein (c-di-GMP phosphodiesterase class II)